MLASSAHNCCRPCGGVLPRAVARNHCPCTQADQTAARIEDQLASLVEEFPNLDVPAFLDSLGADLESLLSDALDQAVSFFGLAQPSQAPDLSTGVQQLLGGVIDGLPQLQGIAKGVLPSGLTGAPAGGLDELTQVRATLACLQATCGWCAATLIAH